MARTSAAASCRSEPEGVRVGLTGGIGSGKSAAADRFAALGAAVVDTDQIAHALTARDGAAIDAIAAAFGDSFIRADGALDRPRMRSLVFSDPAAKAKLEAILHPLIRARAAVQAKAAAAQAPYVLLVVPLLVEAGNWRDRVERVLVVDCPPALQLARVRRRSRLDEALVRTIIARQATRSARLDAADDILVNAGTLDELAERVAQLHRHYCTLVRGSVTPL